MDYLKISEFNILNVQDFYNCQNLVKYSNECLMEKYFLWILCVHRTRTSSSSSVAFVCLIIIHHMGEADNSSISSSFSFHQSAEKGKLSQRWATLLSNRVSLRTR